jgi:hypothetical protein
METGIKPGSEKMVAALLVTAATLGGVFLGAVMLYMGYTRPGAPDSLVNYITYWVPRAEAVCALPMSLFGVWLARQARAMTGGLLAGILVQVNLLVVVVAVFYLAYALVQMASH